MALLISLEVVTDSVPVSSMVPPVMVAPESLTVSSMVTVLASVTLPVSVTLSRVTVSSVSTWPVATEIVPPPLTVAFSILLEPVTDSMLASSTMPPEMAPPFRTSVAPESMVIWPELAISTRTLSVPPDISMVPEPKFVIVLWPLKSPPSCSVSWP